MSTKVIGFPIDLSKGTFVNTEYIDGKLQLKSVSKDINGNTVYMKEGSWESEVISIGDKVTSFEKIIKNVATSLSSTYKIFTKSSQNNSTWTDYVEVEPSNSLILSPTGLYAQVKIVLQTAPTETTFLLDEFVDGKYDTEYVDSSSGSLRLKRSIALNGVNDDSWTDEGNITITSFARSKLSKINSIALQH
ncbi:hypothetical protein [Paenibacillus sp. FSL K6-1230]|uniref:hypothetical protein n=1 Tax=Paenibacillus sp. FSL K6-1230 TaxID=2921603 RepID=UPI0030F87070